MKNIRDLRLEKGISQKKLADNLKVSPTQMRKWERGFEIPIDLVFAKISKILDTDLDSLKSGQLKYAESVIPGEGYTTRNGSSEFILNRSIEPVPGKKKVLDLFCGAGGFSYGFEWSGHFQATCGIDLLPDRVKTFHKNHKHAVSIAADITNFSIEKIAFYSQDPDVIVGGLPCQGFSSIRPFRALTEGDKRNNLVEHYLLVLKKLNPEWFVFENVVGLLSHKRKKFFRLLIKRFEDAGYTIDWRVINAANFGIPQNRERVFVIGNKSGEKFIWPEPTHHVDYRSMSNSSERLLRLDPLFNTKLKKAINISDAIHDLPPVQSGETGTEYLKDIELTDYEKTMRIGNAELTLHLSTNHSEKMLKIIRLAGSNRNALPPGLITSGFSSCYSRLSADKPSTTITVNFIHPASNRCIHPTQDRALTLREGARIQSFPDHFNFLGNKTQVAKQIGNAVPPLLAKVIAEAIIRNE